MAEFAAPEPATLQWIAEALGVSVERLFTDSLLVDADECIRLWFRIVTEEGRRQALEALRAIVEAETPS